MARNDFTAGFLAVLATLLTGCGASSAGKPAGAVDAREARQREVAQLILQASAKTDQATKTAFALAAADQSNEELASTIRAIDAARKVCLTNLRNIDTIGYKSTVCRVGDGTAATMYVNFEQGSLENTSRPLDLGIQGEGFLRVKTPDTVGGGVGYNRDGNLFVNNIGDLVLGMGDGYPLSPPIKFPPNTTEISISQDGRVAVLIGGQNVRQHIGQIKLVRFMNPHGLRYEGGSLFTQTESSGPATEYHPGEGGTGQFLQGFLEFSNVDLIRERARLRFLDEWRNVLIAAMQLELPARP